MKKVFIAGLVVVMSLTIANFASAAIFTLSPVADGFTSATVSYDQSGSWYNMAGKTGNTFTPYRSAYRFDVSSIPDDYVISSAVLSLNGPYTTISGGTPSFEMLHTQTDNLVEGNFSIRPVTFQNLGPVLLSGKTDYTGLSSWDLFANSNWNYAEDLTDNNLTLVIKGVGESTNYQYSSWYSNNAPDVALRPYLTIDADRPVAPVPEPATMTLLGIGITGLALKKRKLVALK